MTVAMQLLVLNPNTSAPATLRLVEQVLAFAPAAHVVGLTATHGSPVIDSAARFAAAAADVVDCYERGPLPVDGVLLACFGDPGLESLRAHCTQPVAGLAEAAVFEAAAAGRRFAIVTAGAAWRPILQQRVADFGFAGQLVDVYTLPVNGQSVFEAPQAALAAFGSACAAARRDGAEVVIAGGAAFAGLAGRLPSGRLPVIDCIAAGTRLLLARVDAVGRA